MKGFSFTNICKRILIYGIGFFILSLGIYFTIKSDLGVSPVSSTPYVLSEILNMDLGTTTIIVYAFCMILQIFCYGKKYRLADILQMFGTVIFGWMVNFVGYATDWIPMQTNIFAQLTFCILGLVCVAVGVAIYVCANVMALPVDGLMIAIPFRFRKIKMHIAKIIIDVSMLLTSAILSYVFLGEILGIGIGTVICALGTGIALKFARKLLVKPIEKFIG